MIDEQKPEPDRTIAAFWAIGLEIVFFASVVVASEIRSEFGMTLERSIFLIGVAAGLVGVLIPTPKYSTRVLPSLMFIGTLIYALLPAPCRHPASREHAAQINLNRLRADAQWLLIDKPELAKASREEWLNALQEDSRLLFGESERLDDYTGIDPWKRPIIIESVGNRILFRSLGRDGVDQHGEGDDIQVYLEDGKIPISR